MALVVGPKILQLIIIFWEQSELICKAVRDSRPVFKAKYGITQGIPVLPTIFSLMVDASVRAWLVKIDAVMEIVDVRRLMACFYTGDGYMVAHNLALLQRAFNSFYVLCDSVGLKTNTKKTKAMIFLPGYIHTCLSVDAFEARMNNLY
jgi:hypothetical protein